MTKALYCALCGTVRTFARDGSVTNCECGSICGWWVDPRAGTARLWSPRVDGREYGRIIGMHNGFLRAEIHPSSKDDEEHRANHTIATAAPGYLFDKSKRACWAVLIAPGESNDTRWATDDEYREKQHLVPGEA